MILYVASYPRSGNSLVQTIFQRFFHLPFSTVYYKKNPNYLRYPNRVPFWENWREYTADSSSDSDESSFYEQWLMVYAMKAEPSKKDCLYIKRGCLRVLTPKNRARLALEPDLFVIKTHETPFQDYFSGEYILQPIRHPGAVLRSYIRLVHQWGGLHRYRTLTQLIRGWTGQGSYASYHSKWNGVFSRFPQQSLRIYYEKILENPQDMVQRIADFLGIEFDADATVPEFESLKSKNPKMYGYGTNEDWQASYRPREKSIFWRLNREIMKTLGYLDEENPKGE